MLLALGSCAVGEFVPLFGQLRASHPQVGIPAAEALLSRRAGLSRTEQRDLALLGMGRREVSERLKEGFLEKKPVSSERMTTVSAWSAPAPHAA